MKRLLSRKGIPPYEQLNGVNRSQQRSLRRLLAVLLASIVALSIPAVVCAEWVEVISDYESGLFVDPASVVVNGPITEALLLWDFADMQVTRHPVKPYHSATRLTYFKCAERLRANVESRLYMGRMAQGELTDVYRSPNETLRWERVQVEAPGAKSMIYVCEQAGQPAK
jgi:hypothetical protein